MLDVQRCALIGCVCWSHLIFLLCFCMWLSSLWQVLLFFFQYISASHRFISCLLCSFILVRYHYQKHTACLIFFFFLEKINCLFAPYASKSFGQPNLGLRESIVRWNAHFSKWLFNFQLWIWIEFPVRLLWHQVEYFLYILRCALKTLVLYFCFPRRQNGRRFQAVRIVQGFTTLDGLLRFFFRLTVNE